MKTKLKTKIKKVPNCASCWDKGWSSYLAAEHVGADFYGEESFTSIKYRRNYCQCKLGRKLLKEESYVPKEPTKE